MHYKIVINEFNNFYFDRRIKEKKIDRKTSSMRATNY